MGTRGEPVLTIQTFSKGKNSMACVSKVYGNGTGAMTTAKNEVFIGL